MSPALTIQIDGAFEGYALELVSGFLGESMNAATDALIRRGDGPGELPLIAGYTRRSIPPEPSAELYEKVRRKNATFPFDLFAAMRFWLADEGNDDLSLSLDEHDRLIRADSAQAECADPEVPIINTYLQLFRTWVEAQYDRKFPRRQARIVLTHDVDDPVNPSSIGHALWLTGAAMFAGKPRASLGQLRHLPKRVWSRAQRKNPQHWNFTEIVDLEARYGARSAFYFASTPWWARGASDYDVSYDVRSPKFRREMKALTRSGAEVGLHLSYNARDDLELLKRERARLEGVCGSKVLGGRHHYWHMKRPFWDTLQQHQRAGLRYDTSVGFNEAPGYRLGVALPFRPWNPETEAPVNVLQIPTMLMDGAILYDETCSVEDAVSKATTLIQKLVASEGTAAIDWHVRTSWPGCERFERWASVYEEVLRIVAEDSEVTFCTPGDLLRSAPLAGE